MTTTHTNTTSTTSELKELLALLPSFRHPSNIAYLQDRIKHLKAASARASSSPVPPLPSTTSPSTTSPATPSPATPSPATPSYVSLQTYSWDQGAYGSKKQHKITIYISLAGVHNLDSSKVKCSFSSQGFDLKVHDLRGTNYRLCKDNLSKEIDTSASSFRVKNDRVQIYLIKKRGEFGYDQWTELVEKDSISKSMKDSDDPTAGLNNLMKRMYEDGDDNMRKVIGEAMLKSRQGKME
eukprot:g5913.t1